MQKSVTNGDGKFRFNIEFKNGRLKHTGKDNIRMPDEWMIDEKANKIIFSLRKILGKIRIISINYIHTSSHFGGLTAIVPNT